MIFNIGFMPRLSQKLGPNILWFVFRKEGLWKCWRRRSHFSGFKSSEVALNVHFYDSSKSEKKQKNKKAVLWPETKINVAD